MCQNILNKLPKLHKNTAVSSTHRIQTPLLGKPLPLRKIFNINLKLKVHLMFCLFQLHEHLLKYYTDNITSETPLLDMNIY